MSAAPTVPRADILLVDDRPANLLALEAVLDGVGDELVRAASGEQALRLLAGREFAVVLLDLRMPGLDGFETAKRVRASDRTRHTPVIFLSATESPEFPVAEAYRLGAVDYLVKPFAPDVLRAKVAVFVELFRTGARVRALERRERERAEAVLRETEQRFARFMAHLPGLAWVKDADGRYLYVNDAAERAFGRPRAGLYGRTDDDLFPPETAARFRANDRRAVADPAGVLDIETLTHADGLVHHSLVSKFPIPGPDGRPQVGGVAFDVTGQKRADEARQFLADVGPVLAGSLDYETTLAAVADLVVPRLADWCAVYVCEPDGRIRPLAAAHADPVKAARARELVVRYAPDPDEPHGVPEVVRTGGPRLVAEVTDDVLVAAARDPDHLAILRRLGPRSLMIVPLAARGRTLGAISFVAAESGRRFTETDLVLAQDLGRRAGLAVDNARLFRESQEALRLLGLMVEASGRLTGSLDPPAVGAAVLDLSHRLVAADAYAIWRIDPAADEWVIAESAGLSDEYVRTQARLPTGGPVFGHPVVAEDARATAGLESRRPAYEAEGIVSVMAVPFRSHGEVAGTLVFYYRTPKRFDDVTVRAAAALADLAGAALHTADLYDRERASRLRAEEADRRKVEFLAVLAHELRNPLAPVKNALKMLELRAGDPDVTGQARAMMDRQVTNLARLVDDLLDVSRIATGKVRLRGERLDLTGVARLAADDHRPAFDAKGVALAARVPGDPAWVSGDPTRLAQVLDNLLANALKFTPAGGTVELAVAEGLESTVELSVRDTGAGLDPDMLPRLFEPFAQADRTLDRSGGGLGLGLAIVKGLAALHGGGVRVESAGLGTGSTFTVTLPLLKDEGGGMKDEVVSSFIPPPSSLPQRRVLIVEDNRDAADSLRMVLEAYGYEVEVAYCGPDGVRAAAARPPAAVICDIGLPGMDGYAVAGELRRNPATAAARLIALTGYGQEDDRRRAMAAGFDEHLTKPADPSVLKRLLNGAR